MDYGLWTIVYGLSMNIPKAEFLIGIWHIVSAAERKSIGCPPAYKVGVFIGSGYYKHRTQHKYPFAAHGKGNFSVFVGNQGLCINIPAYAFNIKANR